MSVRPKIAVSRCLLGERVRFDGGHKRSDYLCSVLSNYFDIIPFCPEVEIGMPIPRDSLRLVEINGDKRLILTKSLDDFTHRMQSFAQTKSDTLASLGICGVIFRSKSPSCGVYKTKLYGENGISKGQSSGLFAEQFMQRFPLIPVEEDGRLHDAGLRENFIERIYMTYDWSTHYEPTAKFLYYFQTKYKYTLMAHSPSKQKELGVMIANVPKAQAKDIAEAYYLLLVSAFSELATVKKHTNVLQHIMGYFHDKLTPDEKSELFDIIENYHNGLVPLIVPITLLNHYVRKYNEPYLVNQHYLCYHPQELMLRNHV